MCVYPITDSSSSSSSSSADPNGEWIKYPKTEHPKFGHKVTSTCLVAKLHSKNNIQAQGIFHPAEMYWITNSDGTLQTHLDVSWVSCYHALTMAESLNKGIFPKIIPSGLDVSKQQWPHEDHWEMPNPLIGYDNLQYHNHDLDEDVDEEWFQGRNGWD